MTGIVRSRRLLAGAALAALAGCASLGGDAPGRQWFRIADRGSQARGEGASIPLIVLVEAVGIGSLDDGTALVYGRGEGPRGHYQFASWSERPSRRIAQLLERRLAARGRFASVGQTTTGIRGDLLLRLTLDEFLHDVTQPPGNARVAVLAELVDWRSRRLIARRDFAVDEPAAAADAQSAAIAFDRAVTRVLDGLAPWAEAAALTAN